MCSHRSSAFSLIPVQHNWLGTYAEHKRRVGLLPLSLGVPQRRRDKQLCRIVTFRSVFHTRLNFSSSHECKDHILMSLCHHRDIGGIRMSLRPLAPYISMSHCTKMSYTRSTSACLLKRNYKTGQDQLYIDVQLKSIMHHYCTVLSCELEHEEIGLWWLKVAGWLPGRRWEIWNGPSGMSRSHMTWQ